MGYYTSHKLEIIDVPTTNKTNKTNEEIFEEIKQDENIGYAFYKLGEYGHTIKGFTLEYHMIEFSKKYPYKAFRIYGEGEENGDIWEMLICNGKSKREQAKVMFPEIKIEDLFDNK